MALRKELLKSIWYAFTALDVEKSGKVSKSQLKVLSHNLYTVLHIPHDPVALEEHFRDDDDGPVSSQGYMPYLNKYILDKVEEGAFVKEHFDELCWTLTAKKNYPADSNGNSLLSNQDAFRLWCLFNFLSEDKYPLIMVPDEVEYLLKKLLGSMSLEMGLGELEELMAQEAQTAQTSGGLSVWQFLELFNSGRCLRGVGRESLSMAIQEVYQELIQDVLKQGYLWKRGHLRRNWAERWFQLQPSCLCYFGSEECKEKRGTILLDAQCCVEKVTGYSHDVLALLRQWACLPRRVMTARASMQAEMELKKEEAARQRQRIAELEEMQERLQEALQLEVKARRDEEAVRLAQTSSDLSTTCSTGCSEEVAPGQHQRETLECPDEQAHASD
ncbi:differentially expressed in FDCP 6 [Cricetulus griseus]|uniref:Differentially expressed in FDCP 6 n=1 Tax=Cricetulus griseus TaxID=10029 RepID=A0A061ILJ7_CRIGR|nr:differentially expressed in FDCP 6 [Cricetulus griseus]